MSDHERAFHDHTAYSDGAGITCYDSTNDDEDRGYPNTYAQWETRFTPRPGAATPRERWAQHAGRSRIGVSGVRVTVSLDGEELR